MLAPGVTVVRFPVTSSCVPARGLALALAAALVTAESGTDAEGPCGAQPSTSTRLTMTRLMWEAWGRGAESDVRAGLANAYARGMSWMRHAVRVFDLSVPAWEIVVRTIVVYLTVLLLLRVAGKRKLGQMSVIDLVVILVIANAVQNSMNGGGTSPIRGPPPPGPAAAPHTRP